MRQDQREVGLGVFVEGDVVDFTGPLEGGDHLFDLGEGSEVSLYARDAVAGVGQGGVRAPQGDCRLPSLSGVAESTDAQEPFGGVADNT